MKNILLCMKKYKLQVLIIVILLVVQAWCDLALPDFTSNIIDVGITNYGIEHSMPQYLSKAGYKQMQLFLLGDEKQAFEDAYYFDDKNNRYELTDEAKDNWSSYDNQFKYVVATVYMINEGMSGDNNQGNQSDMEALFNLEDAEREQIVAMMRTKIEEKLKIFGDKNIASMARSYSKNQYEICGVNINKMQSTYMWITGAKMLLMTLAIVAIAIIVGLLASRVGAGIGRDLRSKVFKKVMGFSNAGIDRFSTASLITRCTNDIQQIQLVTVILLRIVLYSPILAIGGIISVQKYKSGMAWIIILAVAVVLSVIAILLLVTMPKFKIMQSLVDRVNLVAREILTGIPVIRAFGREKCEDERFDDANKTLTNVMLFTNRVMSVMMPVMTITMNGVSVLIMWVAAHKIDNGQIEVGAMTAFITYAMLIVISFLMLTMISIILPRAIVAANRVYELINCENLIVEKENAIADMPEDASIEFKNVSFKYPYGEEDVLENINFTAKQGQTTAIIGSTGCGKSTLVKLIPRFYDVDEGNILIGGVDVKDLKLDILRGQMGFVPQKGVLFTGDINSNIAFGLDKMDENAVREAARIAQAEEFIEEKPDKYESEIAQGGNNVSGGQKQRLAIARAIARNPRIYIFDDSFSALDFKTDTKLRKALSEKTKEATVIIVAQRVSTILNADQILVLEDGKLIGKGTHRELVKNCETYKQIAASQLSENEFNRSIEECGKEEN